MSSGIIKRLQANKAMLVQRLTVLQTALDTASASDRDCVWSLKAHVKILANASATMMGLHADLAEHDINILPEALAFDSALPVALGRARAIINAGDLEQVPTDRSQVTPKLPNLELPKFSGKFELWPGFRDTFKTLVHENESIASVQKFMYLRGCLSGPPASAVLAVPLSDTGYQIAWELLTKRYENEACLVRTHVDALLNLPPTKKDNHASLQALLDALAINLAALDNLQQPIERGHLLVRIVVLRLDTQLQRDWEEAANKDARRNRAPTYRELVDFLESRHRQLEATQAAVPTQDGGMRNPPSTRHAMVATSARGCPLCQSDHPTLRCPKFLELDAERRRQVVKEKRLCYNCLRTGHGISDCQSLTACRTCQGRHHTLLHIDASPCTAAVEPPSEDQVVNAALSTSGVARVVNAASNNSAVLLSTCVVKLVGPTGREYEVRALLDSGSAVNLITGACAARLGLSSVASATQLVVAGGGKARAGRMVSTVLRSRFNTFRASLKAHVLPVITGNIPGRSLRQGQVDVPEGLKLADPSFNRAGPVELLLGNGVVPSLHMEGRLVLGDVVLQNTVLGWIIGGSVNEERQPAELVTHVQLRQLVQQFWEMETPTALPTPPVDDLATHFQETVARRCDGRYVVALPFSEAPSALGESSHRARQAFLALERRLRRNPEIYKRYRAFMHEYEELGHMVKTSEPTVEGYYMPHHCVMKEASLTTKLRVVFNASAPTSTGRSLNSVLKIGPKLQEDLFVVLLRFRCKAFALCADITKMYRQVWVRPEDCRYQRIWWRDDQATELKSYDLQTVTYGTAPASYLAIKALQETALAMRDQYPRGARACLEDFYVDDLFTGADTIQQLRLVRHEVEAILQSGGFQLNKWASNCADVLSDIALTHQRSDVIVQESGATVSALGVLWQPQGDTITYSLDDMDSLPLTKRDMLSQICRVFDPLGLLGPVIIIAKTLMQELWKLKTGWDERLPEGILQRWSKYQDALQGVDRIHAPRRVIAAHGATVELHGFADASEVAFGACIYAVTVASGVRVQSVLLCAKSRVAPLKQASIPRLELAAALLAVELVDYVKCALRLDVVKCRYYSDSQVALTWIRSDSRRFKTFVANRVGEIQRRTTNDEWAHVRGEDNPADLISRGVGASELAESTLWWHGPPGLLEGSTQAEFKPVLDPPEAKCLLAVAVDWIWPEFSSYRKAVRVSAYVLRFIRNLRGDRTDGVLTMKELQAGAVVLTKAAQCAAFPEEVANLGESKAVIRGPLAALHPFLDDKGLLRLGGRLTHAPIHYDRRCPILLPKGHALTRLIVMDIHRLELHAGVQGTLAAVRQRFWPLHGRSIVRGVVRRCVRCRRCRPVQQPPMMGLMPDERVTQCRPFLRTGVDYAGPIHIKEGSRRSRRTVKAYVCVFTCFATKAAHLELVTDLTTEAFMAAFNRLIARRGAVAHVYSDNATNFQGAANLLRDLGKYLQEEEETASLQTMLAAKGVEWHFIPPRAPHFGGLWEAAVKSVKHHLRRVAGNALLTFEEMSTLLAQIEAVLNSRPITPLSEDPMDLGALTPGHFLIGDAITAPPTASLEEVPLNRLSRWQLVEKLRQDLWKRWHREYLSTLHQRSKWTAPAVPLIKDQLVVIKEDNQPPLQWRLGRIIALHNGRDGIARSATVRVQGGTLERPLVKLFSLLPDDDSAQ